MAAYAIRDAEEKWRKIWADRRCFAVAEDGDRPKYYVLEMN